MVSRVLSETHKQLMDNVLAHQAALGSPVGAGDYNTVIKLWRALFRKRSGDVPGLTLLRSSSIRRSSECMPQSRGRRSKGRASSRRSKSERGVVGARLLLVLRDAGLPTP